MDITTFITDTRSLFTVISFLTFIGIIWWAYSDRRADAFKEASMLPFADDEEYAVKEANHG